MREIDEIFDNLEDYGIGTGSYWQSLLNFGMVTVILVSLYLWC